MYPQKPLYPPPWWSPCDAPASPCADFFPRDEFIVRYVGTDAEGNALYCVKLRKGPCTSPVTPIQPRCHNTR